MGTVDILVVEPDRLMRDGVKSLLDGPEFRVVAEASSVDEATALLDGGLRPALALLAFDGSVAEIATVKSFHDAHPDLRLVVLAGSNHDVVDLAGCFEAGADAYLLKTISADALKQSMALVLLGEKVFPTRLAAMLVTVGQSKPVGAPVELQGMTSRENQILRCLLDGLPNKTIGKRLSITEATVKVHLKSLLKKTHATNRTQAAIWALHAGLSGDTTPPP